MVDISLLQSLSYVAAAIGVCIAAYYYVMMVRFTKRNQELALKAQEQTLETRRIVLMDSIIARTVNKEMLKNCIELLRYEWSDYEDFERKYGTENNIDAAATRYAVWNSFDSLGMMLKKGFVEAEDIFDAASVSMFLWAKYSDVIEENRRRYNGESYLRDFEYLYEEMMKVKRARDPSYHVPETLDRYVTDK